MMALNMRRRDLLASAAAAAATTVQKAPAAPPAGKGGKPVLMKLGTQNGHSDAMLETFAAFGVNHICSGSLSPKLGEQWSVDSLRRLRERVEGFGIRLEMVPLPLSSAYISKSENPEIMLARDPERDRAIDGICQMIRNCAQAGIPAVKYNLTILGVVRTEPAAGRGGARYSTFVYDKANQEQLTEAGRVSAEMMWERIGYFLKRVVPVATEHKVKLACHPHDPGMPMDKGFRGVIRVLGSVDGLKRFVETQPSPYHGLNFCQGTVSEMLARPGEEIFDVIRYFGSRKKIFNVHFRNIEGGFLNFRETLPDNGDVNFLKAIRVYKEADYDGMLMPDHVPHIDGDEGGLRAFAYCFGYIQALLQMVKEES